MLSGPLTALRSVPLRRFNEHTRETYRLRVTLTPGHTSGAENALQDRSASVGFGWIATEA